MKNIEIGKIYMYTVKKMRKGGTMFICPIKVEAMSISDSVIQFKATESAFDPITGIDAMPIDTEINITLSGLDHFIKTI